MSKRRSGSKQRIASELLGIAIAIIALVSTLGALNDRWWLGVAVGMTWIVLVVGIDRWVHPMVPIRWKTALRSKAPRRKRSAR